MEPSKPLEEWTTESVRNEWFLCRLADTYREIGGKKSNSAQLAWISNLEGELKRRGVWPN